MRASWVSVMVEIPRVNGPEQFPPYRFYRNLPSALESSTVMPSPFMSFLASVLLAGLGIAPLGFGALFLARDVQAALFLLACAYVIGPIAIPAGAGGIVIVIRVLRLPPDWRASEKEHARDHSPDSQRSPL